MTENINLYNKNGAELFFLNYKARVHMLEEGVIGFPDKQVERMHTKTLEDLISYYEDILRAIGGEEVFHLLELLAKAEHVLAERKKK